MKIRSLLNVFNKKEDRALQDDLGIWEDFLLAAGLLNDHINREKALDIPALSACAELIASTIAMIPLKLYKIEDGSVIEIQDDPRLKLLNDDTNDTLNAFEFWKAIIYDYLLDGHAYAYINKSRNKIQSIHYIESRYINISKNNDPIFKEYTVNVNGQSYEKYDFFKILRNTVDGTEGQGIINQNKTLLSVIYNALLYENILSKTGGNKKGFLQSDKKVDKGVITQLKEDWKRMYSENKENCVILNSGITFKESASTATEMQMNENKKVNSDEICKIFNVPPSLIGAETSSKEDSYQKYIKTAILPILQIIATSANRDLLLEKEKGSFYYAHDTKEVMKGDIEKRFKAYEIAIKNKFLDINEVRYEEDKPPIKALDNTLVLGLNDVLYNTETGNVYTPNTDKTSTLKGGDK
ncbi:MAG: phage portal protein [Clostridium sp.]